MQGLCNPRPGAVGGILEPVFEQMSILLGGNATLRSARPRMLWHVKRTSHVNAPATLLVTVFLLNSAEECRAVSVIRDSQESSACICHGRQGDV